MWVSHWDVPSCRELRTVGPYTCSFHTKQCTHQGIMLLAALGFPYCRTISWPITSCSSSLLWWFFYSWDVHNSASCHLFCPSACPSYRLSWCTLLLLAPLQLSGLPSVSSMDIRFLFLSACSHTVERIVHKWHELCGHWNLVLLVKCNRSHLYCLAEGGVGALLWFRGR